ncbi:MAG: type II secretion system minor pseudopilin GspI [Magnetococcales bacterium]|nr:type II secretion system minor pseudopilin GspI [Magnetococcales bacterium]
MSGAVGGRNGFTLLETMVALAVLAVALSAALRAAAEYARGVRHLTDRTLTHWVAMNQAAERRIPRQWPRPGVQRGSERMGTREWHWTVLISTTPEESVRRMEVQVRTDPGEQGAPLVRLEAFLARP